MTYRVQQADARRLPFPEESVDLIITSPPYHALRGYRDAGEQYEDQIGAEDSLLAFCESLWEVTSECWRVLRPEGSLFVNLGDRYDKVGQRTANDSGVGAVRTKSLTGAPWRYALGLIDDNGLAGGQWLLRGEIIWHRVNALPESATDRVMRRHEQFFHFSKQESYYSATDVLRSLGPEGSLGPIPGSIWEVPSAALRDIPDGLPRHTATFPTELIRRIVLGWSPPAFCGECGEAWVVDTERVFSGEYNLAEARRQKERSGNRAGGSKTTLGRTKDIRRTVQGYSCGCGSVDPMAPRVKSVVADPFGGSGTTALVAHALGRHGVSVDLSKDYCELARWRLRQKDQIAKIASQGTTITVSSGVDVRMAF